MFKLRHRSNPIFERRWRKRGKEREAITSCVWKKKEGRERLVCAL